MSKNTEVYRAGDIAVTKMFGHGGGWSYLRVTINGKYLGDSSRNTTNYRSVVRSMLKARIRTRQNRLDTLQNEFKLREQELEQFKKHLQLASEV